MDKELESLQKFYDVIIEFFVNYSFQLIGAIIIFILGWYVANKVSAFIKRICDRNELDVEVISKDSKAKVGIKEFGDISINIESKL